MVKIGHLQLGAGAPIVVQSMTNTDTNDVDATVQQVRRMVDAGCEMVRITVPSMKEVSAIQEIKNKLRSSGMDVPLVADVHFHPHVAEACAAIVEKVRINPGNYTDKRSFRQLDLSDEEYTAAVEMMAQRAQPLLKICKEYGTAIRIGTNHGSLCDRIVSRYGNTPLAMVMSAMEWIKICENADFHNIVLSMKSSNVKTMVEATLLLQQEMKKNGTIYPLHIGVTEAGAGDEGRVKSAVGIGTLLLSGVGDTIRVSLTEPPENEVPFAQLLTQLEQQRAKISLTHVGDVLSIAYDEENYDRWMATVAAYAGYECFTHPFKNIKIINAKQTIVANKHLEDLILQACRIKITQTEFISCPSCGRTQYDIQGTLAKVKERFRGYPNLKIAVMGCIVNGPGEMADADFGIVGATGGKVAVYRQKERLTPPLSIEEALNALEKLVKSNKS